MRVAAPIALGAGVLFGAGLTFSGMTDPARVRAFLDVGGAWNPALAFVMAGAILPMSIAWAAAKRLERPLAADRFDLPGRTDLDRPLLIGAALFGVGWGLAGLCPGPAVASLATHPGPALVFIAAMLAGMVAHAAWARRPAPPRSQRSEFERRTS